MAFFKSQEQKETEKIEKEEAMLRKYGLQDLRDPEDVQSVRRIVSELAGTALMETGALLGGASEKDIARVQMFYQRAIVEQNFMIIRLLDRLCQK